MISSLILDSKPSFLIHILVLSSFCSWTNCNFVVKFLQSVNLFIHFQFTVNVKRLSTQKCLSCLSGNFLFCCFSPLHLLLHRFSHEQMLRECKWFRDCKSILFTHRCWFDYQQNILDTDNKASPNFIYTAIIRLI